MVGLLQERILPIRRTIIFRERSLQLSLTINRRDQQPIEGGNSNGSRKYVDIADAVARVANYCVTFWTNWSD